MEEEATEEWVPLSEDLNHLETLKKLKEVPKFQPYGLLVLQNTTLTLIQIKIRSFVQSAICNWTNKKKLHICTLELQHTWKECVQSQGAYYRGHSVTYI